MWERESCQAVLERQLIYELVSLLSTVASPEEQQRTLDALIDLLQHVDPTLDATQLDPFTRAFLEHEHLWRWPLETLHLTDAPRALLRKRQTQKPISYSAGNTSHGK